MDSSQKSHGSSPSPALSADPSSFASPSITTTISSNTPHKRTSSSGSSFLSRLPFIRSSPDHRASKQNNDPAGNRRLSYSSSLSSLRGSPPVSLQQDGPQPQAPQKTRRRRGSLRKVALLGRTRVKRASSIDSSSLPPVIAGSSTSPPTTSEVALAPAVFTTNGPAYIAGQPSGPTPGLGIPTNTPLGGTIEDARDGESAMTKPCPPPSHAPRPLASPAPDAVASSPTTSFSTTDDDDALHMPKSPEPIEPEAYAERPTSQTRSSYLAGTASGPRKRSIHRPRSPLAINLATTTIPPTILEEDCWNYDETERWGWVILTVTWTVFVVGMGSVLGIWGWAWDVGKTPYAPPELENDETLPITGYYPALMILTCVMAWVWVFVAWIGMKYFRHAKIGGDK